MRRAVLLAVALLVPPHAIAESDRGVRPPPTAKSLPAPKSADLKTVTSVRDVPAASAGERLGTVMDAIEAARVRRDWPAMDRLLESLLADPAFADLPEEQRAVILTSAGENALVGGDAERAGRRFRDATALASAPADAWWLRARAAERRGDAEDAALALTTWVRRWPAQLPALAGDEDLLFRVAREIDPASPRRAELLQALFDADWKGGTAGNPSGLWHDLAVIAIERGDDAGARAAIARVSAPEDIVKLRADRRFDALVPREGRTFDAEATAARHVEDLRARALLDVELLDPQVQLAQALLTAGRFDEAIALADAAEAELRAAPGAVPPWADYADSLPWLLNIRANAWRASGRIDAAIAELERASEQREQGVANVSQVLNLGNLLCNAGRPAEALAAIARVGDDISPYGRMVLEAIRLCAGVQTGDAAAVDKALAYIASHRATSESIYQTALVEAGRLDEAAGALRERLQSPWLRAEALLEVQDFIEPPPLPGTSAWRSNRRKLMARTDVGAAIDAVGRRQSYRIYAGQ